MGSRTKSEYRQKLARDTRGLCRIYDFEVLKFPAFAKKSNAKADGKA